MMEELAKRHLRASPTHAGERVRIGLVSPWIEVWPVNPSQAKEETKSGNLPLIIDDEINI
jgi:hypothetical protein